MRTAILAFSFLLFLSGSLDLQADGRIEINQAVVNAAGGFPYVISTPGSYVLTSNLVVTTDVSAIQLEGVQLSGREVSLDLNGFAIEGAFSCKGGGCSSGSANGIGGTFGEPSTATVRNGAIRGFSGSCVFLSGDSRVEGLFVSSCGGDGILVDSRSVVLGNRVSYTGQIGINMGDGTTFAHNTVSNVNLSGDFPGIDFPAVKGGKPSAGNSCDDDSCTPTGKRAFYMTKDQVSGGTASTACATGYHVAHLSEIWDPSSLYYNIQLGRTTANRLGPPLDVGGWAYTTPPFDCSLYTSLLGSGDRPSLSNISGSWTWTGNVSLCSSSSFVWCVQD